jgi:NAD(P)-dependent dehydrogenase (short-subunit alcohol dehydrogenase family)
MLTDKVCLVTGAGSGMGRATSIEMARQGARVVIVTDVNVSAGEETVAAITEMGTEMGTDMGTAAVFIACDVSDGENVAAVMSEVGRRFGVLDVLHNNAGVIDFQLTRATSLFDVEEDVWDKVFDVNVKGSWLTIKHAKPLLARSRAGVVVNCASVASFVHCESESVYVASKAAIVGLTRTAAVELAPFGVRCVAYAPGAMDTPMSAVVLDAAADRDAAVREMASTHLIPRLGTPEDVARFVCFLASDDAAFITGSTHLVDGGMLAWRGARA